MSLRHAVLGVLEARAMTGYDLTQFFHSTAGWLWSAPHSQIYPALRQLEKEGLVDADERIRGERLRSVVYSVNAAGLDELRRWVGEDHGTPSIRDPLLLQAIFFEMIDAEVASTVLDQHVAALRERMEQWEDRRVKLLAKDTPLLRERLARRPREDHDRIAALKAHSFEYLMEVGRLRICWARRAQQILRGEPPRSG